MPAIELLRRLPWNALSMLWGRVARLTLPRFMRKPVYELYIRAVGVNREEVSGALADYRSLSDFFVRPLPAGRRPMAEGEASIVSPVDGAVAQFGRIRDGTLIQAKGREYQVRELIRNESWSARFLHGSYLTIYLSPKDYHRIHAPCRGEIAACERVPGRLFTVLPWAARVMPNLFTTNERISTFIESEHGGVAVVKVGATCVGSIRVSYDSVIANTWRGEYEFRSYASEKKAIRKGEELGRFEMGSTVIVLLESESACLTGLEVSALIKLGTTIAYWQ